MQNENLKRIASLILAVVFLLCMAACGGIKGSLPGTYDNGFHTLQIYSDGTYEESLCYGTGTWTLLDGNVLKLTDFYGESKTFDLTGVDEEGIHLESGSVWARIK